MKKAYLHLIKYALAEGKLIAVNDGEEVFKPSGKYKDIKDNIEAVEIGSFDIVNKPEIDPGEDWSKSDYVRVGWAAIIIPGPGMVDNEESVADYSAVSKFMDAWNKKWYEDEPNA